MNEKDPFAQPPNPDKAFAYGEAAKSLGSAQEALVLAQNMTNEDKGGLAEIHPPALRASLDSGVVNPITNVNMLKVPEARRQVEQRTLLREDRKAKVIQGANMMQALADKIDRESAEREAEQQAQMARPMAPGAIRSVPKL